MNAEAALTKDNVSFIAASFAASFGGAGTAEAFAKMARDCGSPKDY